MSDKFERLKQLLSAGATSDECLFYDCNDSTIVIGGTRLQTFRMPLTSKYIKKLVIVYTQDGKIVLRKHLKEFTTAGFDKSLLYFSLSEQETMKFKEGKVQAQLKLLLEDNTILVSQILKINAVKTLDDMYFSTNNNDLVSLQAVVKGQDIQLTKFSEIPAGGNKINICKFIFDSSWDNMTKKATFKDEYNNYIVDVELDENDYCAVPYEVISGPGNLYIGVIGTNDYFVRPTNWSNAIRVSNSCMYAGNSITGHEGTIGAVLMYRIIKSSDSLWQLQKSDDGKTWTNVDESTVDISGIVDNLADIAWTGNVNDLVQTDGDILELNSNDGA